MDVGEVWSSRPPLVLITGLFLSFNDLVLGNQLRVVTYTENILGIKYPPFLLGKIDNKLIIDISIH